MRYSGRTNCTEQKSRKKGHRREAAASSQHGWTGQGSVCNVVKHQELKAGLAEPQRNRLQASVWGWRLEYDTQLQGARDGRGMQMSVFWIGLSGPAWLTLTLTDFTTFWHVKKQRSDTSERCSHALVWADKPGEKLRLHHLQTGLWPTSNSFQLQLLDSEICSTLLQMDGKG